MMIYVLGALAIAGAMCASVAPAGAQATPANDHATTTYVAHLRALNTKVSGMQTTGEARFTITGDSLTISVAARHVPPDIMHLQHFHGFTTRLCLMNRGHGGNAESLRVGPSRGS